ncbi:hypothetical protein M3Y97_00209200 [Aphelenchoides bicaudatus]|nr:hypothetical protein M3Y97_00209200 [Aphelenchoides bicaudatus]
MSDQLFAAEDKSALCEMVSLLYDRDWTLKFVYLMQFIMSSMSLVCMTSLALLLCAWSAFSTNIRLLMISQLSALSSANIGVLLSCIYHLQAIIFRGLDTRCYWFSFTYKDCYVIRLIYNVSTVSVYASAFVMAIDRICSSLIEPRQRTSKLITCLLIVLQWTFAIVVNLHFDMSDFNIDSRMVHQAHCTAHVPTPTQSRQLFFVLMGMVVFTLAIYTTLCCHHASALVVAELRRYNKVLYENVVNTESTFPLVIVICLLYVFDVCMDRNFQIAAWSMFTSDSEMPLSKNLIQIAQWTEFQTTLLPLMSLVLFGILIRKAWPEDPEKFFGQVVNEYAQNLENFYESRNSDALSFHSVEGALRCNKDVRDRCEQICNRLSGTAPSTPTTAQKNIYKSMSSLGSTDNILNKESTDKNCSTLASQASTSSTTSSSSSTSINSSKAAEKTLERKYEMDTLPI